LAGELGNELGAPVVPMDGFHLPNATLAARGHLDIKGAPETFAADEFVELMLALRKPAAVVHCPTFDRTSDEPVPDQLRVVPADAIVIVEGNYLLLDEQPWVQLADVFDDVAYLETPSEVRIERLIDRHVEFGCGRREALEFVHRSDEVNAQRIESSRSRADLLVSPPVSASS